jgi:CP family cyanate transporter-like MFS transporter
VVGILALAGNLRAALAGYPPLLPTARADLGLSAGAAGAVQAGAVLAMAVGSFAAAPVAARFDPERALGATVGLVGLGCLVRGLPVTAALVAGTALVGLGIGMAGVCLAGVARARFASRVGVLTGGYVVAMLLGSTVASAVAVPLATLLGGWSFSLAVWAVPALVASAAWAALPRGVTAGTDGVARPDDAAGDPRGRGLGRSRRPGRPC